MRAFAAALACLLALPALAGPPLAGPVTRVIDGDTLVVGGTTVRLCGVDTPERGEAGFYAAAGYLAVRVSGRPVRCIPVGEGTPCDGRSPRESWGRVVAQCFYGSADIAAALVAHGLAKDWPAYSGGYYAR